MREHVRIAEVQGKRYRIRDFDALGGGFVFLFVTRKIVPLLNIVESDLTGLLSMEANKGLSKIVELVIPVLDSISQEDLQKFMAMCLEQVEIELPAGFEKVMRNGEFTNDEVKYSTKLAFMLCFEAIKGLLTDFFGENALSSITKAVPKAMKQSSRRT